MGDCSSKPNDGARSALLAPEQQTYGRGAPQASRKPARAGSSGFGQPVAAPHATCGMTGKPDGQLYNSLPPCEMAPVVKKLHPKYGGPEHGIDVLSKLYRAICDLNVHGLKRPEKRYLPLTLIKRDPNAIKIARYAGFMPDPLDLDRLSADGEPFQKRLSRNEFGTLLLYIEAMLGGVPNSSAGLIY